MKTDNRSIKTNCCDAWWTGLTTAHCSSCHNTFTSVANFELHRSSGECRQPKYIGLVPADKPWPGWSQPAAEIPWWEALLS